MNKLTLLFVFLLLTATANAATTRYVSPSGSGSTCSSPSPCSLSTGAAATTAGDTLILKDGTYDGRLSNAIASGSSGAPTIVQAENTRLAILKPTTGSQQAITFTDDSWIEVRGIKVDMSGIGANAPDGIKIDGTSHDIEFLDVEVGNLPNASGFVTRSTTTRINVRRCYVHDTTDTTTSNGFHGLYWAATESVIEHCHIKNVDGYGIQIYETTGQGGTNTVVRYNFFTGGTKKSAYVNSIGTGVKFFNNIVWGNSGGVIERKCNSSTRYINNVFYGNTGAGLALSDTGGNCAVLAANNISLANTGTQISNTGGGATLTTNLTTGTATDIFIDPASGNFNLKESSAAIDAGTVIAASGNWPGSTGRYVGAGVDQGAFEAPIRSGAVVEDTDKNTYVISLSLPSQSTRNSVGLQGCTTANFTLRDDGAAKTESACNIVGTSTVAVDVSDGDFTAGVIDDAYARGTLRDSVGIGDVNGVEGTNFFNAYVRDWAATAGTNNVGSAPAGAYEVVHYRCLSWYSDTTPVATDFLRAEDAATATLACPLRPGGLGAVVIALARNTDDVPSQSFEWHFNRNAGGYGALTNTTSATAIAFAGTNAPSMSDGASTDSVILTNPHATYIAGQVVAQQASQPTIDFSADSTANIIILVKSDATATVGDTYCLQPALTGQTVSSITQTKTPCFQITYPASGM